MSDDEYDESALEYTSSDEPPQVSTGKKRKTPPRADTDDDDGGDDGDTPHSADKYILGVDIGIRKFAYCLIRVSGVQDEQAVRIVRWEVVDLTKLSGVPVNNCNRLSSVQTHKIIEGSMSDIFSDPAGWRVRIEAQPSGRRARVGMIVLSHLVLAYFRQHPTRPPFSAGLITSRSKYSPTWLARYGIPVKSRNYEERKKLSLVLARHMLDDPRIVDETHKPARMVETERDMADALLMAISDPSVTVLK